MMGRIGVKVWIYRGDILPEVVMPTYEAMVEEGTDLETGVEGKTHVTAQESEVSQAP
jgi:ribosomal protein S3